MRLRRARSRVIHRFVLLGVARARPRCRTVSGMTGYRRCDQRTLLTPAEVVEPAARDRGWRAGPCARASGAGFADATDQELRLLEEQGELARQRFIRANLRLVGMVSGSSPRVPAAEAELFQEGCVGLITAVERFDYARGYRFSTYALVLDPRLRRRCDGQAVGGDEPADQPGRAAASRARAGGRAGSTPRSDADRRRGGRRARPQRGLDSRPARPPAASVAELLDGAILDRLRPRDALDAVVAEPVRCGNCCSAAGRPRSSRAGTCGWDSPTASRGRSRTQRGCCRSRSTRVRRIEARALETLRGICPQQASASSDRFGDSAEHNGRMRNDTVRGSAWWSRSRGLPRAVHGPGGPPSLHNRAGPPGSSPGPGPRPDTASAARPPVVRRRGRLEAPRLARDRARQLEC